MFVSCENRLLDDGAHADLKDCVQWFEVKDGRPLVTLVFDEESFLPRGDYYNVATYSYDLITMIEDMELFLDEKEEALKLRECFEKAISVIDGLPRVHEQ